MPEEREPRGQQARGRGGHRAAREVLREWRRLARERGVHFEREWVLRLVWSGRHEFERAHTRIRTRSPWGYFSEHSLNRLQISLLDTLETFDTSLYRSRWGQALCGVNIAGNPVLDGRRHIE